jgi:HlyD family secretion protein
VLDPHAVTDPLSSDLASLRIQRHVPQGPRSTLRVALSLAAVGAVVAAVYFLAVPKLKAEVFKTEVDVTEIAMVSPVQAQIAVTSTGYVVPQLISKVGAKVPGRVGRILVKEGDTVKAGDLIAQLEDSTQKSAILAAQSRVAVSQARAGTARATLGETDQQVQREQTLLASGAVGRATLEDLVARQRSLQEQVKAADAEARAAQSDVDQLHTNLQDYAVYSPISGTIVSKPAEAGEMVGPVGASVAEIADFKSLMVETDVPEARLHMVKIGGPCEIVLDAYPDKRYRGATAEFGQRVNRSKATVTVKVRFVDAMDGVLPDMAARVSFLTEEIKPETLAEKPKKVIPGSALADRGGAKVVFVVDGGKLRMTPVTLGAPVGSGFELVDGPPAGTKLVSNPPADLVDGREIKEKGSSG